jgi:hypothetical protein
VEPFDPYSLGSDIYLASLDLEVSRDSPPAEFYRQSVADFPTPDPQPCQVAYWFEKNAQPNAYSADELQDVFRRAYDGLIVTVGQPLVFDFHGQNLRATVKGLHNLALEGKGAVSSSHARSGILTSQTEINFIKDPASAIKIKSSAKKYVRDRILRQGPGNLTCFFPQASPQRDPGAEFQVRRHGNRWTRHRVLRHLPTRFRVPNLPTRPRREAGHPACQGFVNWFRPSCYLVGF